MMKACYACFAFFIVSPLLARTITVDLEGNGDVTEIQGAIDFADDGDTVLVKAGVYEIRETIKFNRLHDPENPLSPPVKNITLRSEAGPNDTTIHLEPEKVSYSMIIDRLASVMVFENGEGDSSVLEGFTITGGRSDGVRCVDSSSPTIKNCRISNNEGAGLYCDSGSSPAVSDCTISENSWASGWGGGVYCVSESNPALKDCTITGNSGYGILCRGASPALTRCKVAGNEDGIHCQGNSPSLIECVISGNRSWGLSCAGSSPILTSCDISGNSGLDRSLGGGLVCSENSSPELMNCRITGNGTAARSGGGVHCWSNSSPILRNCTISGNCAIQGGGIYTQASSPRLKNCIVWDNAGGSLWASEDSSPEISHSCLEGDEVWPGAGNIKDDPLFCGWTAGPEVFVDADLAQALDPREYSLTLQVSSPCLGTGEGGADMGADTGTCESAGHPARLIHLAAGIYEIGGRNLAHRVSLQGAGEEETVIQGTVCGLRSGAFISRLAVTGGTRGGIVVSAGEEAEITRCTITENSSRLPDTGAGVHCGPGSWTRLSSCTITGNSGNNICGAVHCEDNSTLIMENSRIRENEVDGLLGGMGCSLTLTSCEITGNSSGGLSCGSGELKMTHSTISGHPGRGIQCSGLDMAECLILENGTGVFLSGDSSSTLTGCTISGSVKAGISCSNSSPQIKNCRISRNGVGVTSRENSSPALVQCTIRENGGAWYPNTGGGVDCEDSSPILKNCTISGNFANTGGGIYCKDSSPTVTSCIVWGNCGGSLVVDKGSLPQVAYSCIEGGEVWPGPGNIQDNPLFCGWTSGPEVFVDADLARALDPDAYSLALLVGSPCLGTGEGGSDMGSDNGICESAGSPARLIHLAPGVYSIPGGGLAHGISLQGSGEGITIIVGTLRGLRTGDTVSRLTITGGEGVIVSAGEAPEISKCTISRNGGGLYCGPGAAPKLKNCTIRENTAIAFIGRGYGGGVHCEGASPILTNCTILGNRATHGGGIYLKNSAPLLIGCTIVWNHAERFCDLGLPCDGGLGGGVFCNQSSPVLRNCTIWGNSGEEGGGLYCKDSSPILSSCIVWDNRADSLVIVDESEPQVTHSCLEGEVWPGPGNISVDPISCGWARAPEVFVDASSPEGGDGSEASPFSALAPALDPGEYDLSLSEASPCIGTGEGGGNMGADLGVCESAGPTSRLVHLAPGMYEIAGMRLDHRLSLEGSGEETVIEGEILGLRTGAFLSDLTVRGGVAVHPGDAPEIRNCTILGGGGVIIGSTSRMTGCKIMDSAGRGLVCLENSTPIFQGCSITGNRNGGVYCGPSSSPTFLACTISGNTMTDTGDGSPSGVGIYFHDSPAVLINCLIEGNKATEHGWDIRCGICYSGESASLFNCTVTGNNREIAPDPSSIDSRPRPPVLTNCIVWGGFPAEGQFFHCLTDRDPRFVDPGNGDFRLQPGSPAIDAGSPVNAPETDIEGNRRPCWNGVDIGAHEYCGSTPPLVPFLRGDANADGTVDLSDGIRIVFYLFLGASELECLDAADADDGGDPGLEDALRILGFLFLGEPALPEPFEGCGKDPTDDELSCNAFPPCHE